MSYSVPPIRRDWRDRSELPPQGLPWWLPASEKGRDLGPTEPSPPSGSGFPEAPGMKEEGCQGVSPSRGGCSVHPAPGQGRLAWGVGGHKSACVRPCTRGAEERAVWLICPIKLLQTLPRQLLPAGPWVQIGSVSLPQGGVSGAGEWWPAQSAHRGPAPTLPIRAPPVAPSSLCSCQHPLVPQVHRVQILGIPAHLFTILTPMAAQGSSEPSLPFSRSGGFMLYKGCHVRKPSRASPHAPFPPR